MQHMILFLCSPIETRLQCDHVRVPPFSQGALGQKGLESVGSSWFLFVDLLPSRQLGILFKESEESVEVLLKRSEIL